MKRSVNPLALAAAAMVAGISVLEAGITIEMVTVGDAGNPADQAYGTNPAFGSVAYAYAIGKYEVTNFEYAAFLNAVAAVEDTFSLYPATDNPSQAGNAKNILHPLTRGIVQTAVAGGFTYSIAANMADKPANFVTWFSAARFANWMANGQPTGGQTAATTEDGAYTLDGMMSGGMSGNSTVTRNPINPNTLEQTSFWLPSEDEWYKAAYYDPGSIAETGTGYWLYATGNNTIPTVATATATGDIANPGENVANYASGSTWNGQAENLTSVGSAGLQSASHYGTSDQAGNVWEWSEGIEKLATARGLRQGSANDPAGSPFYLAASFGNNGRPPDEYYWNAGFRIAAIPEPGAAALLVIAAALLGRRIRRAR
jgi:formylglycine-generating enzyme required for sulfatase activity